MYLKSLELTGFKSFAEAKIVFPEGVTAVVGPNGAGKSNVVDAILWVLGEQSTKTLRSERMEDIIFNGTESRKPLGMAEVSLIIADIDGKTLVGTSGVAGPLGEFQEVMITRRLYRNGESEYLLNKSRCRLKDIRDMLLDTRAGIKGHTVIEQSRINHILNASPHERRELIEETAGIVRYKKQKAEALRKLDATHQNLLRVRDIVAEVRRQMNSLDRQARQAKKYQRLQEEAKQLEVRMLVRTARVLLAQQEHIHKEVADLEVQESAQVVEQASLTSDAAALRVRLLQGEDMLHRLRENLTRAETEQGRAVAAGEVERNKQILNTQQQEHTTQGLEELEGEREALRTSLHALETRLAQQELDAVSAEEALANCEREGQILAERRSGIAAEEDRARRKIVDGAVRVTNQDNHVQRMESTVQEMGVRVEHLSAEERELSQQCGVLSHQLNDAKQARGSGETRFAQLRGDRERTKLEEDGLQDLLKQAANDAGRYQEELAAVESRFHALERVVREDMGYGRTGEEETTSLRACEGIREALAEWLIVPPGLERTVEVVVGERGRGWLVEDPHRGQKAIEFLKQKRLGRGLFIPLQPRKSHDPRWVQDWQDILSESGVLGWATDFITAKEECRDVLAYLFQGVLIVETLDIALRLWAHRSTHSADGPLIVTLEGDMVNGAGVVTGGELDVAGGLLHRKHEVQQLEVSLQELDVAVGQAKAKRDHYDRECQVTHHVLQGMDEEIRSLEMQLLSLGKDEEAFQHNLDAQHQRLALTRLDRGKREEEQGQLTSQLQAIRDELAVLQRDQAVREAATADLSSSLVVLDQQALDLQTRTTEARLAVAALRTQREHDEQDLAKCLKQQDDQSVRQATLAAQLEDLRSAGQLSKAEQTRQEALALDLGQAAQKIRTEYVSAQEEQAGNQARSQRVDAVLTALRVSLESTRQSRLRVEVHRAEVSTQCGTVEHTLAGTYRLSLADALAQYPDVAPEVSVEVQETGDERTSAGTTPPSDLPDLHGDLQRIREKLERMGPINLAAIEEHLALEERYTFLASQEEDLSNSITSLKEIIHRINRTTKRRFVETFGQLQQQFGEVFARFFPGGRAELVLMDSQEEAGEGDHMGDEPGVDIVAQPPGKRLKNITMLSGGEKTLTALALVFASFLIRPTPFCILDEIDAPLDEENIGRFADVLCELSKSAQFIVVTHNKRTMSIADSLFGVTMEDPGVSKLLSIRLAELQPA